jgi:low temperature requirement protein LtrA
MIEETHRATTFEIFFDLVFAFALTRITALMGIVPIDIAAEQFIQNTARLPDRHRLAVLFHDA